MVTDENLKAMLTQATDAERGIRIHLSQSKDSAGEQARGLAAYRHAVALRRSLEEWTGTRAYRAAHASSSIG